MCWYKASTSRAITPTFGLRLKPSLLARVDLDDDREAIRVDLGVTRGLP